MLYSDEELGERDMDTNFEHYLVEKISHPCEENLEIYKIYPKRMPYLEENSTFEGKEDLGEGHSLDGEDLWIDGNYCNTPTCFERTIFLRMECTTSCY